MKRFGSFIIALGAISLVVLALLPTISNAAGTTNTISGTVFRDYNANGSQDTREPGIQGIIITAYDANGTAQLTTQSAADGTYSLTPNPAGKYRIEFTLPDDHSLDFLRPGIAGATTVQFVDTSNDSVSNVNVSFFNPADYSEGTPDLVTNWYREDEQGQYNDKPGIMLFAYNAGRTEYYDNSLEPEDFEDTLSNIAESDEVGTTFGLAWERSARNLYAAAFMKRFAGFGPGGTGAIYKIDQNNNVSILVDVNNVFGAGTAGNDPHPDGSTNWSHDYDGSLAVGKVAFGGLAISDDETTLYTVNLASRELYEIPIADPTNITAVSMLGLNQCDNSDDFRPFAVQYQDGKLYVGVTCTAESTVPANPQDDYPDGNGDYSKLWAYVYQYNPASHTFNTAPVIDFALNYPRDCADVATKSDCEDWSPNRWMPWIPTVWPQAFPPRYYTDNYGWPSYPQPWLTDIEFDNGDMLLGFRDRFGDQTGYRKQANPDDEDEFFSGVAAGELLRACYDGSTWQLESNGACGGQSTNSPDGVGPGGNEYYWQEFMKEPNGDTDEPWHSELTTGGLVQIPGASDVATTAFDMVPLQGNWGITKDGGIMWLDNLDGTRTHTLRIYHTDANDGSGTFAKLNGLGDLEALPTPAPLELGNRLWCDTGAGGVGAENGIQDPGEATIADATVTLECDTDGDVSNGYEVSASTNTLADGTYLFKDGDASLANFPTANWDSTLHIIPRRAACRLRVNVSQAAITNSCGASNNAPTTPDNGGTDAGADLRDSDGDTTIDNQGYTNKTFTTGNSGENNHSYDFGFKSVQQSPAQLSGRVWHDKYHDSNHKVDGIQDSGEPSIQGVVIELYDSNGNLVATDTTDANGYYEFTNLTPGNYTLDIANSNYAANGALDESDDAIDWHASQQDAGSDDTIDSDGDENTNEIAVTLASGENKQHLDYGLFNACIHFTKTGPSTMTPGVEFNFHFRVENCGDVVHHGGASVYDALLEPSGNHEIWNGVVYAGEVKEFDKPYTPSENECPSLLNEATGEGHPVDPRDGGYLPYVSEDDDWTVSCHTYDWGDAPDTYKTTSNNDGPSHRLGDGLLIGNLVDAEADGAASNNADGDDTNSSDDDEDAFPSTIMLTKNGSGALSIPVQNPLSEDATLYGWIDFNGDGDFLDSGEYVTATAPANTNAPVTLNFGTVPSNSANNTFARFRITTDQLCSSGTEGTYRDEFTDNAYNNSDGSLDWSNIYWQELGDDGSPCAGRIRLCNDELFFSQLKANEGIKRSADLSNATSAYLSFDWRTENLEEKLSLYISADGVNYILLDTFGNGNDSGHASYDISDYISPNTTVRFMNAEGDWSASNDQAFIDNLQIQKSIACVGGLAHDGEVEDHPVMIQQGAASIGDLVWLDSNANGIQDAGESGLQGVTVKLLDGNGNVLATTNTDTSGVYSFTNLTPDNYAIKVTLPSGYHFSPQNQGSDDAKDSDVDTTSGETATTTLIAGENDLTWDAGVYQLASIGDFVWWDQDEDGVQDANEPGLQGVTVTLKNAAGSSIGTTTTDANGAYSFTDLTPGTYSVSFTLPGSDWSFSPQDQGSDDSKDSDADTASGNTATVTLNSGQQNTTRDAGMTLPSSYTITKANTTAETELAPGDPISFTITIKNTGKTWLASIPLTDTYDSTYLAFVDASPATENNVDDGEVNWADLTASFGHDLAPGQTFTIIVNFDAKSDTESLPNHQTINHTGAHDVTTDPDGPSGPNGAIGSLPDQQAQAPVNILNPVLVTMSSFQARAAGNAIWLQWQSLSEYNILGFNLLRSVNGSELEQVNSDLIPARYAGADMGSQYRINDRTELDGTIRYVLQVVRLDGSTSPVASTTLTRNGSF